MGKQLKFPGNFKLPGKKKLNFVNRPGDPKTPGVKRFIELKDCPSDYVGQAGKYPKVNAIEDGLEFASGTGGVSDHALLTHLAYADANHTGFEPTVTKGNLTAGTGITIGGTGTGAVIGAGASVTNSAPDQTVVLNNGTGISVTGTYPTFTITNTGVGTTDHSALNNLSYATAGHTGFSPDTHTHAQLHDSATISDTTTINMSISGQQISGDTIQQMSITSDASGLKLSGDATSPGNNYVYGTNGSGTKGWKADPTSGSGSTVKSTSAINTTEYLIPAGGGWHNICTITLTPTGSNQVLVLFATLDGKDNGGASYVIGQISGDFGASEVGQTASSGAYETISNYWVFEISEVSLGSKIDFKEKSSYTITFQAQDNTSANCYVKNIQIKAWFCDSMDTTNKFGSWS